MTGLNQLVRLENGEITTVNDLDKKGLIKYEVSEMTGKKRNGERRTVTKYHAVIIPTITENGATVIEISKFAYFSKTNQKNRIQEEWTE